MNGSNLETDCLEISMRRVYYRHVEYSSSLMEGGALTTQPSFLPRSSPPLSLPSFLYQLMLNQHLLIVISHLTLSDILLRVSPVFHAVVT